MALYNNGFPTLHDDPAPDYHALTRQCVASSLFAALIVDGALKYLAILLQLGRQQQQVV